MSNNTKIIVRQHSYGMNSLDFPEPCEHCGSEAEKPPYVIDIGGRQMVLCKRCLEELNEQINMALHKTVKLNDTVWELTRCDDGEYRIFPMIVKNVCQYGSVRWVKGKEPTIWNVYAEGNYTKMYRNFYELGKTWFITEEAAKSALKMHQDFEAAEAAKK